MRIDPVRAKWEAFGWEAQEVDGHDVEAVRAALLEARERRGAPQVVIAETVKGQGVSFMAENPSAWHGKGPSDDQLRAGVGGDRLMTTTSAAPGSGVGWGEAAGSTAPAATREAYGASLLRLAREGCDIVALDADLSASTGGNKLASEFPQRWFTVGGGGSQHDFDGGGGWRRRGRRCFAASFAVFLPGALLRPDSGADCAAADECEAGGVARGGSRWGRTGVGAGD